MKFIKFIVMFQILTIFIFFYGGVIYYEITNGVEVVLYVIFYLTMLYAGALVGTNRTLISKSICTEKQSIIAVKKYIGIGAVLTILFSFYELYLFYQAGYTAGDDSGLRYSNYLYIQSKTEYVIYSYMRQFASFYTIGFYLAVLLYWKTIDNTIKLLVIGSIFVAILTALISGLNRVIFDFIMLTFFYVTIKFDVKKIFKKMNIRYKVILVPLMLMSIFFGFLTFTGGQLSREGSTAKYGYDYALKGEYRFYGNAGDSDYLVGYSALSAYVSQGYVAFNLALNHNYEFLYMVSSSTFLSRQVDKIFDTEIEDRSYPAKNEIYGIDKYNKWSTLYVWLASDFTFIGVAIVLFFYGYLYSLSINAIRLGVNFSAVVLLSCLVIQFYYLSANNQIFQSGEKTFAFFFAFAAILFRQKIVRIKNA